MLGISGCGTSGAPCHGMVPEHAPRGVIREYPHGGVEGALAGYSAGALVPVSQGQQDALTIGLDACRDLSHRLHGLAAVLQGHATEQQQHMLHQQHQRGVKQLAAAEAHAMGDEAARLAAAVASFQGRLAQATAFCSVGAGWGLQPLPPPSSTTGALPRLGVAPGLPPLGEEMQYAADSIPMGLLPDTAEVNKLVEQLDSLNGTIRVFDELLAAAGTKASLGLGASLPKDDSLVSAMQKAALPSDSHHIQSVARQCPPPSSSSRGGTDPRQRSAGAAAAAAAIPVQIGTCRPPNYFGVALFGTVPAALHTLPPQRQALCGYAGTGFIPSGAENVVTQGAPVTAPPRSQVAAWAMPAGVAGAAGPSQPCSARSVQHVVMPSSAFLVPSTAPHASSAQAPAATGMPDARALLPPTYEGVAACSGALLPPTYEALGAHSAAAKAAPAARVVLAAGDADGCCGASRLGAAEDTSHIASLLCCSLEVAPQDTGEKPGQPACNNVVMGEGVEHELFGHQDSTVPGMPTPPFQSSASIERHAVTQSTDVPPRVPDRIQRNTSLAAALAETALVEPILAPKAACPSPQSRCASTVNVAAHPLPPLQDGGVDGAGSLTPFPNRPAKRLGIRRVMPQVPVMRKQRTRSFVVARATLDADAIETSQDPIKVAPKVGGEVIEDSCVAPGAVLEDSFPPTAPVVPRAASTLEFAETQRQGGNPGGADDPGLDLTQRRDNPIRVSAESIADETQHQGVWNVRVEREGAPTPEAPSVAPRIQERDRLDCRDLGATAVPPRKRQRVDDARDSKRGMEADSTSAIADLKRSLRKPARSRPDLSVVAASADAVEHLGSYAALNSLGDDGALGTHRAGSTATLVPLPAPADLNLSPVVVLFTGFARGDLHRFRRCVSRLCGHTVRELGDSAGCTTGAPGVRVVTRCVAAAAPASSSTAMVTQRTKSGFTSTATAGVNAIGAAAAPCATRVAANRTMKYFHALLAGAWVVSSDWVLMSNSANRWLLEADFEILGDVAGMRGPTRGHHPGPRLFEGLRLHFPGSAATDPDHRGEAENGPSPADLEGLAQRGGGVILSEVCSLPALDEDPPHLSAKARAAGQEQWPDWWRRPIAIMSAAGASASGGQARRSSPRTNGGAGAEAACDVTARAHAAGWAVLPSSWMLDCISLGELLVPPAGCLTVASSIPTLAPARRGVRVSGKPPIDVV